MLTIKSNDSAKNILLSYGYVFDQEVVRDGNINRIGINGNTDQWYICYENYIVAGDWQGKLPDVRQFIDSSRGYQLSIKEWEELERKIELEQKQRESDLIEQYSKASLRAQEIWNKLSEQGNSAYLEDKKLKAIKGIKFGKNNKGNFIATSITDNQGNISSIQYIYDNKTKLYLKGGKRKGCYSEFSRLIQINNDTTIFICEGVATGLSILLSSPESLVVVAYDCGNLKNVAQNIILKYPSNKVVIAGDNDISNEKYHGHNIGKKKAEEAAKEFNIPFVLPAFKDISSNPSDFDDLRQLEGINEVRNQLETSLINNDQIIPIKNDNLKEVKKFDVDNFLPDELKDFVKDVSRRLCVPADFVAIPLIIGISSLIAGKATIKPKQNDDFCVFPNLWGGLIANPSTRKTPSLKEAIFFFSILEKAAQEDYEIRSGDYEQKLREYKMRSKYLENKYSQLIKENKDESLILNELALLQEPKQVFLERYRINEATTQKITEILKNNKISSLLLERDELSGHLSNLEKKENESDRSYFLEMWNGNASIRSDTIGRGSICANNSAISIIGTTQPDLIKRYLERTLNSLNDGLLQRFQLLVYPDPVENKYIDTLPNRAAKQGIIKIIHFLNDNDFSTFATGSIEKEGKEFPYFSFNEEAQVIYQEWYKENNQKIDRLYKEGKFLISQHLSKFHKLLPALCLIFHLVKKKQEKNIDKDTISKAVLFCDYLESHAIRIYGMLNTEDNYNNPALALIEKIKHKISKEGTKCVFLKGFTKREIKRKFSSYQDEELNKVLDVLIDHNYLIEKYTPAGRQQREKCSYFLNQHLMQELKDNFFI